MKKRLSVLLLSFVLMISLIGCSNVEVKDTTPGSKDEKVESMFVLVETAPYWQIAYHKETKVMYAISFGGYNTGNFTLLVNADGTPMIWDGE